MNKRSLFKQNRTGPEDEKANSFFLLSFAWLLFIGSANAEGGTKAGGEKRRL